MTVVCFFFYPFQQAVTSLVATATAGTAVKGWLSIIEANGAVG